MKPTKWNQVVCILIAAAACATARDAHATCSWKVNTGCVFGQYTGSQLDTTGTATATCAGTEGTGWIEIHASGADVDATQRYFINPGLEFFVYQDAARTQNWGDVQTNSPNFTPINGDTTLTLYCRIPGGQTPANNTFTQTRSAHIKTTSGNNSLQSMPMSVTINGLCSTSVTTNLSFGAYDPIVANKSSVLDGTATLSVNCTNSVPYTITLGQGSNPAGTSTDAAPLRRMAAGANMLSYSLYQNTGRTTVWGNTSGTGVAGTGTGSAQTITVYGRIPSGQNAAAGSHSDTVLVTLTF
jgi:spore coat protein U-like protein